MKHIKAFESFVNEKYMGKWKAVLYGKMPGAPKSEVVDAKVFKNEKDALRWVAKQPDKRNWSVEPEEGWIDPIGTWHPDDDDYWPGSAYESDEL